MWGSAIFGGPRTQVIVWKPHRLLYLRVPKSANTSIWKSIPDGRKKRMDIRRLHRAFPGYLSFSFVRNPWARLVSAYTNKIRTEKVNTDNIIDGVHHGFVRLGLPMRPGMPFEEFAEIACSVPDEATDRHLKSQCFFLVRDGTLIPRFVGRVESMGEDWRALADAAGMPETVPHLNRTRHDHYTRYYPTARLRNLVGDRYRNDIETFGYDFAA
jgi:dermatan 4-sulfotransferase 1